MLLKINRYRSERESKIDFLKRRKNIAKGKRHVRTSFIKKIKRDLLSLEHRS